jgi:hypothetical protein
MEENSAYKITMKEWLKPWENLIVIRTMADGSCLFHALLTAFYLPYQKNEVDRKEFVFKLREELADNLGKKAPNAGDKTYYEILSGGYLARLSQSGIELGEPITLEGMKRTLGNPCEPISELYLEYISMMFNKDLYFLDIYQQDVYMLSNPDLVQKGNRISIVVGYKPGHYETVGLPQPDGTVKTAFEPNDEFIVRLRNRYNQLKYRL